MAPPPPPPGDSARLAHLGELGGLSVYGAEGGGFLVLDPRSGWRSVRTLPALVHEANTRIAGLQRERALLIAVLAAFPLMLMALVVLVLTHPVAAPGPSLSLAAAVAGCLLTGALIAVGAWVAGALLRLTP